jgi:hypothetical protein
MKEAVLHYAKQINDCDIDFMRSSIEKNVLHKWKNGVQSLIFCILFMQWEIYILAKSGLILL